MPLVKKPELMVPRLRYRVTFRAGPPGRQSTKQIVGQFLEETTQGYLFFKLRRTYQGKRIEKNVSIHKANFLDAVDQPPYIEDEPPRRV